jgi:hypothetical protein
MFSNGLVWTKAVGGVFETEPTNAAVDELADRVYKLNVKLFNEFNNSPRTNGSGASPRKLTNDISRMPCNQLSNQS